MVSLESLTPKVPLNERDSDTLIEDLCIALREVAVRDCCIESANTFIIEVQQIHRELVRRNVDFTDRLSKLSAETSWRVEQLLGDCLQFPATLPYVIEKSGLRRALICHQCAKFEMPDRKGLWLCDNCLLLFLECLRSRTPQAGIILFRTFNQELFCRHANSETVLATFQEEPWGGYCENCILEEQQRRLERKQPS